MTSTPTSAAVTQSARLPVLLYHRVTGSIERVRGDLEVSVATFDEHVSALHAYGWHGVGVTEALRRIDAGDDITNVVALSFDDAFGGFTEFALPILQRLGWSATMYVPTAHVGGRATWIRGELGRQRLLSWNELAAMRDAGIEIGSHGHEHHPFDLELPAVVTAELRRSREVLGDRLGIDATSFAYPNGYAGTSTRGAVRDAGFESACIIGHDRHPVAADRFAVRRLIVRGQHSASHVLLLAQGQAARAERVAKQVAATPWRQVRRARHLGGRAASTGRPHR